MTRSNTKRKLILTAIGVMSMLGGMALTACSEKSHSATPTGVSPKQIADMLHSVMAADRTVYAKHVVTRLVNVQKVMVQKPDNGGTEPLKGSEDWEKEYGKLPLPAQMFRMGSELAKANAQKRGVGLDYSLISSWAINKKHMPTTDYEKAGLKHMETTGEPYYHPENVKIAEKPYFIAMYPDKAVAKACWSCHNDHPDSPKTDFKADDVMGGIIIRVPVQ